MLCAYLCAAALSSWISLSHCAFKYADDDGGYKYCWTIPYQRRYEPYQAREQAIAAIKKKLNASFCDISYVQTIDPWLKHNQTRYKIFIIAEHFVNRTGYDRQNIVKEIVQPILNNPGDSRVEILANTLEEKPEGLFTEEEMNFKLNFMDLPNFGGNRLRRSATGVVHEFHMSTVTDLMEWKFHPNKTCRVVEETIRAKFDPLIVKCESMHEEVRGRVGPGHEDQYRLLVVAKKFLDQPPLRRTINVRKALEELIIMQMYKIHMRLKTPEEYEAEKDIVLTTNFKNYV